MLLVDLTTDTLRIATEEELLYLSSTKVTKDISMISHDLVKVIHSRGWLNDEAKAKTSPSSQSIGSNIFTTIPNSIYEVHIDKDKSLEDGTEIYSRLVLSPTVSHRFIDTDNDTPISDFITLQKLLRVKYGDDAIEQYINRLIHAHFDMPLMVELFEMDGLSIFKDTFLHGWWLIPALWTVMNNLEEEIDF